MAQKAQTDLFRCTNSGVARPLPPTSPRPRATKVSSRFAGWANARRATLHRSRPKLCDRRGCPRPRSRRRRPAKPMDGKAQTPPRERRPGWPQRTSGNGAWATQTYRDAHLLLPQENLQSRTQSHARCGGELARGAASLLAWSAAKARRGFPDPLAPFSSVPVRRSSDPRWALEHHPEITRDHPECVF